MSGKNIELKLLTDRKTELGKKIHREALDRRNYSL